MMDIETSSGDERRQHQNKGTATDIANQLGVSRAAVSYALNGKPGVSMETRRAVLELARSFGMNIPDRAKNRAGANRVVGLVLADLGNPFYQELGVAVSNKARQHRLSSLLSHTWDNPVELMSAVQTMTEHGVDGIILTATQDGDASVASLLRRTNTPYVQVSRKMPTVKAGFVGIDNKNAAKDMALHLVDHGYKKIALAIGPRRSSASNERQTGYLEGLIESGLSVPSEWIIRTNLGMKGGTTAGRYLRSLKRGLPEAVICGTDAIAFGLMEDFASHGIGIPDEVAITGFDGVIASNVPGFSLTTVVQPIEEMAEQAVRYLEALMRNDKVAEHDVICPYKLRIGNSCRCAPTK
ncbi:LacI family DNA-binding transcriptional regulator [Trueperella bialowiezensis]|uniref:Glucose-resistance amylase regulator n=1 Tax=Trueperella bialowiezensis TaxID=312285 RepID=A0A3S4VTX3_9ACTO|nr:LacI family DNA-binding transcriptional regulator [Trueperella bialowiezensis]VEI13620.1 Glucose-resistance amylase regulator [Trueperella bialowiezensis]